MAIAQALVVVVAVSPDGSVIPACALLPLDTVALACMIVVVDVDIVAEPRDRLEAGPALPSAAPPAERRPRDDDLM